MDQTVVSWKVTVTGLVQGVFFRAYTREHAERLGVSGWVRNLPDGSVQALLQHTDETVLREMLAAMENGPEASNVESVSYEPENTAEVHSGFVVRQ